MRRWTAFLLRLYVTAACVCLLAPILIVVILAFSGEGYLHFPPTSLSLQWFARFFGDLQWQHALLASLVIGAIACLVSTTVGFFAAYAFLRAEFHGKKLLLSLMLTPIIVPSIITAIAMYYLAGRLGLIGNFLWLGLGGSRLHVFCRIVLPLALPGILSAALFAFLASFDELLISLFLAGVRAQTLPVRIWNSLNLQVEPTIAAVSAFLIGVTTLILAADGILRRRRGRRRQTAG